MSLSLEKGQNISLEKEAPNVDQFTIGLGWTINGSGSSYDLDASILMLNPESKMSKKGLVYFGNKNSVCGSIKHSGDNLVGGSGTKDDEQIFINLKSIPSEVDRLQVVVNIYGAESKRQSFGGVKNAYCRVFEAKRNKEVCKYNLSNDYSGHTFIHVADIYRHEKGWKFKAVGQGFSKSLNAYASSF